MKADKKGYINPKISTVCMEDIMPLICERLEEGQSVKFSPRGTSMLPMLRQGDSVVLSPCPEKLKKYDLPLYRRDNGEYVLHRVVKVGKSYTCIGDNQFEYEHGIEHRQMIGVVTAFVNGKKERSVDEWKYRVYCRARHFSRPARRLYRALKSRIYRIIRKIFYKNI